VRGIAEKQPSSDAKLVDPNLVDAYVWLMTRDEDAAAAA
jgi:hypothetical protein